MGACRTYARKISRHDERMAVQNILDSHLSKVYLGSLSFNLKPTIIVDTALAFYRKTNADG